MFGPSVPIMRPQFREPEPPIPISIGKLLLGALVAVSVARLVHGGSDPGRLLLPATTATLKLNFALLLIAIAWSAYFVWYRHTRRPGAGIAVGLPLLGVIGWLFYSATEATLFRQPVFLVAWEAALAGVSFFLARQLAPDAASARGLFSVLLAGVGALTVSALFEAWARANELPLGLPLPPTVQATFDSSETLAAVLLLSFPPLVLAALLGKQAPIWAQITLGLVVVANSVVLGMTDQPLVAALVTLGLGCLVLVHRATLGRRAWAVLVSVVVLFGTIVARGHSFTSMQEWLGEREFSWQICGTLCQTHPWTGVGMEAQSRAGQPLVNAETPTIMEPIPSAWLALASGAGLPAAVMLAAALLVWLTLTRSAWITTDSPPSTATDATPSTDANHSTDLPPSANSTHSANSGHWTGSPRSTGSAENLGHTATSALPSEPRWELYFGTIFGLLLGLWLTITDQRPDQPNRAIALTGLATLRSLVWFLILGLLERHWRPHRAIVASAIVGVLGVALFGWLSATPGMPIVLHLVAVWSAVSLTMLREPERVPETTLLSVRDGRTKVLAYGLMLPLTIAVTLMYLQWSGGKAFLTSSNVRYSIAMAAYVQEDVTKSRNAGTLGKRRQAAIDAEYTLTKHLLQRLAYALRNDPYNIALLTEQIRWHQVWWDICLLPDHPESKRALGVTTRDILDRLAQLEIRANEIDPQGLNWRMVLLEVHWHILRTFAKLDKAQQPSKITTRELEQTISRQVATLAKLDPANEVQLRYRAWEVLAELGGAEDELTKRIGVIFRLNRALPEHARGRLTPQQRERLYIFARVDSEELLEEKLQVIQ